MHKPLYATPQKCILLNFPIGIFTYARLPTLSDMLGIQHLTVRSLPESSSITYMPFAFFLITDINVRSALYDPIFSSIIVLIAFKIKNPKPSFYIVLYSRSLLYNNIDYHPILLFFLKTIKHNSSSSGKRCSIISSMEWLDRYTTKRISQLKQENIHDIWRKMYLEKAADEIFTKQQDIKSTIR